MPGFADYEGICHVCEGRVYRDGGEAEQIDEDNISWYVYTKEPIICLECGFPHYFLRIWKNMDVTNEFRFVKQKVEKEDENEIEI